MLLYVSPSSFVKPFFAENAVIWGFSGLFYMWGNLLFRDTIYGIPRGAICLLSVLWIGFLPIYYYFYYYYGQEVFLPLPAG